MIKTWTALGAALVVAGSCGAAYAQAVNNAVGGYSWEEAAKEAEGTKNFHSNDGVLTFAIVTHTAGNGFFDPHDAELVFKCGAHGAREVAHAPDLRLAARRRLRAAK